MKRTGIMVLGGLLVYGGLVGMAYGQGGTDVTVTVPTEKYATFIVPERGAELTLTIQSAPSRTLVSSQIIPADTSDLAMWHPGSHTGPGPHGYTSAPVVLSSREWLHISGTLDGGGGGGHGVGGERKGLEAFDVDVPAVDITMAGVDEDKEETQGGYVGVGTNCLQKVTINKVQSKNRFTTGKVKLTVTGGAKIRLWEEAGRIHEIATFPKEYTTPSGLPKDIWVEGVAASGAPRDVELKASYTTPTENKTTEDKVKITVIKVDIELVGAPTDGLVVRKGANVTMKANIEPTTYILPTGEPKWYYQCLKADGSWESWSSFGTAANGRTYTHTTTSSGVFRVKTILTIGGFVSEKVFARTADDPHSPSNPLKAGDPDAFGVVDNAIQITLRNTARAQLGSTYYRAVGNLPALRDPLGLFDGRNKCNVFVADMCDESGADVDPPVAGVYLTSPPSANNWAGMPDITNPSAPLPIPHWALLGDDAPPQPGHVCASGTDWGGISHCGIVDYDGRWISASATSVTRNGDFADFRRRYSSGVLKPAGKRSFH